VEGEKKKIKNHVLSFISELAERKMCRETMREGGAQKLMKCPRWGKRGLIWAGGGGRGERDQEVGGD